MPTSKPSHDFESGQTSLVTVERRNGNELVIVTLNRPEMGNRINRNVHRELEDITHQLIYDKDARAVIIAGAGDNFCAGPELEHILARAESRYNNAGVGLEMGRSVMRLVENILDIRAPVISAVQGLANGLGATLALFADVVIAADNAVISDNHVFQGQAAGDGGACMWPLLIGPSRAKWHLMTGDPISAQKAEQMGLVNQVVPAADLMPTALALAERLSALPPLAVKMSKMAVNKYIKFVLHEVGDLGFAWQIQTTHSEDHLAAMRALVNKTPRPRFEGK